MGSLFRSEEMTLCQFYLPNEAAYACISELGEIGLVQFRDLNPDINSFQRKFVTEVRRCNEMERQLRYVEKEIKKLEIKIVDTNEDTKAPEAREMIDLEAMFQKIENELREVIQNDTSLKRNFMELTELKNILQKTEVFFNEQDEVTKCSTSSSSNTIDEEDVTVNTARADPGQLSFVTGVILRARVPAFERMLWRACRGNVFLRLAEIDAPLEDPVTGDRVDKSVFIIFFQGDQLKTKVKKICEGFRAVLYPCPEVTNDRREMLMGVITRLDDLINVLTQTEEHHRRMLVAAANNLTVWFVKVRKIKAIYHTLNLFNLDVTQQCLIGEGWLPFEDMDTIDYALRCGTRSSGSSAPAPILNRMETREVPPTFNRNTKYTQGFQNLVDSYGYANYREINPAPFTVITFPFLFAVMFGDCGHGLIIFLFGLFMIVREKQLVISMKNGGEIWNIFFGGRYILFLMGSFSMYTGLIYNDMFSLSLNIFGSHWYVNYNTSTMLSNPVLTLDPATIDYAGYPYPFGLDPAWQLATDNKIQFLNTYKMKISVIIGVFHMLFGLSLSVFNHRYFHRPVDIFCEFLPQILFMLCIFFWLCFLIFYKWVNYFAGSPDLALTPGCAPSVLIIFINMMLFKSNDAVPGCNMYMFTGQEAIQKILVIVGVLCIPWMLLIKPFILRREYLKHNGANSMHGEMNNSMSVEDTEMTYTGIEVTIEPSQNEEEFDFTEVFIHQSIHTIEYILGCVSHTASYLRLWALSLAHEQLSEVLWTMVMHIGLSTTQWYGFIILWFIFAFWAALTVSILVLMEGLSAFLHTLRLHWVEFQSKFYTGAGYAFAPFEFKTILREAELESEIG